MMLMGAVIAASLWFGYLPVADTTTAAAANSKITAPRNSGIIAPGNRGIITQGQTGGVNTIIQGDDSPAKKIRSLFNGIDPDIMGAVEGGHTNLVVRMEPFQIQQLKNLIGQAGAKAPVSINGLGHTCIDCLIDNGTLGVSRAVHMQQEVFLTVRPSLLLAQEHPQTGKQ